MEVEKALKQMHPLTALKRESKCFCGEAPHHSLTNKVLVAHEMMNHISKKRNSKCGEMAIKLDMSKAYDRVEWEYLKQIMMKLKFHMKWISRVMRCVSSVKYAVRINGQPYDLNQPTQGLRQGDPLSPYLFLICTEGLSALLHQLVHRKAIKGVTASLPMIA